MRHYIKRKYPTCQEEICIFYKMVDKLKEISAQKGYTLKSLERACGFGNSTIGKWDKNIPSIDKVLRVCAVLQVPLSAVIDDPYAVNNAPVLTPGEQSLLTAYRELNEEGQRKVLDYARDLTAIEIYKNRNPSRMVAGE